MYIEGEMSLCVTLLLCLACFLVVCSADVHKALTRASGQGELIDARHCTVILTGGQALQRQSFFAIYYLLVADTR